MDAVPISDALRTWRHPVRGEHEAERFMTDLMTGRGSRSDYVALVAQHYFVYSALEDAAEQVSADPDAAIFLSPQLTRLPAIEQDLRFLIGVDWRERIAPLPSTARYVQKIRTVAREWPAGYVAHHYTRYLGDLSSGRVIRALLQKAFGFDTNGVGFYLFDQIAAPREFKSVYRAQLDSVDWSPEHRERMLDEARIAYRASIELVVDVAHAQERLHAA